MAATDVIGTSPVSFTDRDGTQRVVPLSAFELEGTTPKIKAAWIAANVFDGGEQTTLFELLEARVASGELEPPPLTAPRPAVLITAAHPGADANGTTVTATADSPAGTPPLETKIKLALVWKRTYSGLATAEAAALALGVDVPTGVAGDPAAGTGAVVVKEGTVDAGAELPKAIPLTKVPAAGLVVKAEDATDLFTLVQPPGLAGSGGSSVVVTVDAGGASFTIEVVYSSAEQSGADAPVTLLSLAAPAKVAYFVELSAPSSGLLAPADATATLAGGATGIAATGLLYSA